MLPRHEIRRQDPCCRIGLTFPEIKTIEARSAEQCLQKILNHGDEIDKQFIDLLLKSSDTVRIGGENYEIVTRHSEDYNEFPFMRNYGRGSSIGYIFDCSEVAIRPTNRGGPSFILSPSISVGFDISDQIARLDWPPSNASTKEERMSDISFWKYWIKIHSDEILGMEKTDGLGFPRLHSINRYFLEENIVRSHMKAVTDYLKVGETQQTTPPMKIVISAATCLNSHVFSNLHSIALDSNDIEAVKKVGGTISQQVVDIETELEHMVKDSSAQNFKFCAEKIDFLWCTLEEGASGMFGMCIIDEDIFIAGLAFSQSRKIDSLLDQNDPAKTMPVSSLVTRGLMNQMTRWS